MRVLSVMVRVITLTAFLFTATVSAASMTTSEADRATSKNSERVSFKDDLVPILKQRCAVCHITGQEPGLLALIPTAAYQALVGVMSESSQLPRVSAGEPDKSYLHHKLRGTHLAVGGDGAQMPFNAPPLPAKQQALFDLWIAQGAQDN